MCVCVGEVRVDIHMCLYVSLDSFVAQGEVVGIPLQLRGSLARLYPHTSSCAGTGSVT